MEAINSQRRPSQKKPQNFIHRDVEEAGFHFKYQITNIAIWVFNTPGVLKELFLS